MGGLYGSHSPRCTLGGFKIGPGLLAQHRRPAGSQDDKAIRVPQPAQYAGPVGRPPHCGALRDQLGAGPVQGEGGRTQDVSHGLPQRLSRRLLARVHLLRPERQHRGSKQSALQYRAEGYGSAVGGAQAQAGAGTTTAPAHAAARRPVPQPLRVNGLLPLGGCGARAQRVPRPPAARLLLPPPSPQRTGRQAYTYWHGRERVSLWNHRFPSTIHIQKVARNIVEGVFLGSAQNFMRASSVLRLALPWVH
mmetsp:Transcript_17267/g.37694  ORF Transcript_17267/g.37694 Transcript_17267/m.37694 type:complete len:249 (+) Transcript_17267:360-1106(+)